jgi:UDP-2,3-diacylglucosamine hydrolase
MNGIAAATPIAILAGGGKLPQLVTAAALRDGRAPVVFAIAGEAEPDSFAPAPVHIVCWGEIGRLFRLTEENGCREAVLIGSITRRPDYRTLRPDFGAVKLIPRIVRLMAKRDNDILSGVAKIIEENGIRIVSPLAIAPDLALPEGSQVGSVSHQSEEDIEAAVVAAREVGRLDIAQGAVAVGGRVVAVEDATGTDALLQRVALLRRSGAIHKAGGVLVKCLKPKQDGRHDLPTIGPSTAEFAKRAGLAGVAAEAGRAILVGRDETIEAFRSAGLFLLGLNASQLGHG